MYSINVSLFVHFSDCGEDFPLDVGDSYHRSCMTYRISEPLKTWTEAVQHCSEMDGILYSLVSHSMPIWYEVDIWLGNPLHQSGNEHVFFIMRADAGYCINAVIIQYFDFNYEKIIKF